MWEFLKRLRGASDVPGAPDEPAGIGMPFALAGKTSIYNLRELGGYPAEEGTTLPHRFLRSGALDGMRGHDAELLKGYGVRRVLDLRGSFELRGGDGPLAKDKDILWLNVPLFDYDISDPDLMPRSGRTNYLCESYYTILANRSAMKRIFSFFAEAGEDECILFHCAAGMDRTGMVAMLLLGLAGVDRQHIVADYSYSFGGRNEVDRAVLLDGASGQRTVRPELGGRIEAISEVYGRLIEVYGSADAYLDSCSVMPEERRRVKERLLGLQAGA